MRRLGNEWKGVNVCDLDRKILMKKVFLGNWEWCSAASNTVGVANKMNLCVFVGRCLN